MIPLAIPNLSDQDQKYLLNAFKSNWISTAGPQVVEFEQKFKSLINMKYRYIIFLCKFYSTI